jgi:hypothetical protein
MGAGRAARHLYLNEFFDKFKIKKKNICQTLISNIEIVSLEIHFSILNTPERSVKSVLNTLNASFQAYFLAAPFRKNRVCAHALSKYNSLTGGQWWIKCVTRRWKRFA